MGKGSNRNKLCRCGSGRKIKNCKCKLSVLDRVFPDGKVLDMGNGMSFHVMGMYDTTPYTEFKDIEARKYAPFYSPEQIRRILNPTAAKDILLKKQADSIVDNIRVERVFFNRYNCSKKWDYENIIDDSIFEVFKLAVSTQDYYDCIKDIPCGMTYDSDPNGQCIRTSYGNIITISAILEKFLYYMNLFYMGYIQQIIPKDVTRHALILAIRIMLKNEALDFELDPRGDVPVEIDDELTTYTVGEMCFVVAHEFSHSILNHLDTKNIVETEDNYVYYNMSQLQEFEADDNAIHILKTFMDEEEAVAHAINFFMGIDLYEQVKEQICPSNGYVKTHPKPMDRVRKLLDKYPTSQFETEYLITMNNSIKNVLMDLVSTNFELFEMYGSVYLGQWHKINKIDRVDY